jgi:predicted metal-dependent hydrolase
MFGRAPVSTAPSVLTVPLANGETVDVTWKRSASSRSLRIRVSSHGAIVTTPPRVSENMVQRFLRDHSEWLAQHAHVITPLPSNELWYRGKPFQVQITFPGNAVERVAFVGETCFVSPVTPTAASATKVLERWLITQAGLLATPWIQSIAVPMKVEVPQLRFRQTKSRWGSCSQHGAIMLKWRLIHAPDEVFRYVVVHELAHRVHMNHSKDFWDLVRQFDPSYPIHRGWLKRHGNKCATPELQLS